MKKFRHHLLFTPLTLFLAVVLSGLTLPVHHIHPIKLGRPSGETQQHQDGDENHSSTFQDVHLLKLLSSDSFNASNRHDDVPPVAYLAGPTVPAPIGLPVPDVARDFAVAGADRARDTHALLCTFLI